MKIESTSFKHKGKIPPKHTCEGDDISPPLKITEIPPEAVSLAIIIEDPDAPVGTFDHWLAWNFSTSGVIPEDASPTVEGVNHFGVTRYRGPCPPRGPVHRYFFKVFALDRKLNIQKGSTKKELEAAMNGHIIQHAILIGTYARAE